MKVSFSMMDSWMRCPLQARFKYVDRLPTKKTSRMAFGIIVHKALEHLHDTGDVQAALSIFTDLWDNPEKIKAAPEIWPRGTTHGGFREKGIELITTYHERLSWESRTLLAQEHRFLVPIGEHELQGVVDLLDVKKSGRGVETVRVIDFKTGSKQPYKNTLRHNLQFTAYDYASRQPEFWMGNGPDYPPIGPNAEELWEKYKKTPRRGIWFHLLACKEIDAGERTDVDFMRLYRVIKEIARALEHEVYVPVLSADTCVFCDFTEQCGIKIPEREYDEDDKTWF